MILTKITKAYQLFFKKPSQNRGGLIGKIQTTLFKNICPITAKVIENKSKRYFIVKYFLAFQVKSIFSFTKFKIFSAEMMAV
jgi:hypothetical protein